MTVNEMIEALEMQANNGFGGVEVIMISPTGGYMTPSDVEEVHDVEAYWADAVEIS